MYEELRSPFSIRWAREVGFGAKSLMRLQRAGLMVSANGKLRLLDASPELVATTAIGGLRSLGHRSAASWYDWPLLNAPDLIDVVVPRRRKPTPWPGARIIRPQLEAAEIVRIRGVPVTAPLRTALDLAVHLPLADSVAALDGACRKGGLSIGLLRRELRRLNRPKPACVADLINPLRASVYESLFAVLLAQAGIAEPRCQFEVRRGNVFIARADFAWASRRVIVEIDGFAHHSSRAAFEADRRRPNALVNEGWRVLRFTPTDLLTRPKEVIAEVRTALSLPLPKSNAPMIKEMM
jgi:very-short-patch-repair endonuclease